MHTTFAAFEGTTSNISVCALILVVAAAALILIGVALPADRREYCLRGAGLLLGAIPRMLFNPLRYAAKKIAASRRKKKENA